MTNKNILESKMKLYGDTGDTLSAALGINPNSFSQKKNGVNGREFTQTEINVIKERYNLTADEVDAIFFA